ncbi:hypothetical protein [Nannocystis radixulma]|uniref:Peptidase M61 catalytic domain-containing protein n=1 Tax=Nannocystis radixulma TaxID=2995305 RepID=A0ABT5AZE8_9BACT|nr:hypothetical protein [Nannocystis radixulma]MDC0667212.1 hypothetical protein [Nannocystis radixulma]
MRLGWAACVACGLACGPEPVAPPAVAKPEPGPAAPAEDPSGVVVTVTPHEGGVRVVYELPAATDRVALVRSDALRRDEWQVVTPGVRLVDGALVSEAPRTSFEVVIPPDTVEVDRVYPSLHRVGRGVALYGPALRVEGVDARIVLRPAEGGVAIPEQGAERGYAWLGPADAVIQGEGFRMVAGESVGPRLVEVVRGEAEVALGYYARKLERPGRAPTILVSLQNTMTGEYRGDASESDVISLRFFDSRWNDPEPGDAAILAKFVRHEAFHLWNADTAPGTPPWLHEGGAEYAAIVAAVDAGALTHEQGIEQVSSHLDRCRTALGARSLAAAELSGPQIYWCGVALQWIADTEARGESQGQRDVFAIWRDLLRRGEAGGYSLADLRAVTGPIVAAILDDQAPERWQRLAEALAPHGATLVDTADDHGWRTGALQHLLAQHCKSGEYGFYVEADHVRLDTTGDCGPIGGNPEIVRVAGANIMKAPRAAFDGVRTACAAKEPVTLETRGGAKLRVGCTQPPELPVRWKVVDAPPLSRAQR